MTNDSEVYKEFIQPRIQDWKNIYEKLDDGYSWILESISEIKFTFVPASDEMNIESDNEDFDIGEYFIISYPEWNSNSMSRLKTNLKKSNGKKLFCFISNLCFCLLC
jgi:hypothetical protein